MRTMAIALSILLSAGGAHAATTPGDAGDHAPASTNPSSGIIRLAGAFSKSPNKLADKYLSGRSGGRYGIGGTDSKIFKKKKK